jgi:hypothetical protein
LVVLWLNMDLALRISLKFGAKPIQFEDKTYFGTHFRRKKFAPNAMSGLCFLWYGFLENYF